MRREATREGRKGDLTHPFHVVTHQAGQSDRWREKFSRIEDAVARAKVYVATGDYAAVRVQQAFKPGTALRNGTLTRYTWRYANQTDVNACFRQKQGHPPPVPPPSPQDEPPGPGER